MGIIRMGAPRALITKLRDLFGVKLFVEAGTYNGETARWAATEFEQVVTIENSQILYDQTSFKYNHLKNVQFIAGDTRKCLEEIVPSLEEITIFWLDSHWCGGDSYGESDQCPLLEELEILNESSLNHIVLIDDARLFLAPPPLPNNLKYWPGIDQVIVALKSNFTDRYIVIQEDVIIAVPGDKKDLMVKIFQKVSNDEWHAHGEKIKKQQSNNIPYKLKQLLWSLLFKKKVD